MPGFTELVDGREIVNGFQGVSAVRIFHDDGGPANLPQLGSTHPATPFLILRRIRKFTWGRHALKNKFQLDYEVPGEADLVDPQVGPEDAPRSYSTAAEFELLTPESQGHDWTWTGGAVVDVPIRRKIIHGHLFITEVVEEIDEDLYSDHKGNINEEAWPPGPDPLKLPANFWLYNGFDGDEFSDDNGDRLWRLRHNFESVVKITTLNIKVGWNFIWRPDLSDYDAPLDGAGNSIYQESDFALIFPA